MGWFDEQIRLRKRIDDELYQRSYANLATKVLGQRATGQDDKTMLRNAIEQVLSFYNYPKVEIPLGIKDPLEQIEYAAGAVGIMKAGIKLKEGWYTDCFGPIICFLKDGNLPVALFPMGFARYYYRDPETGRKIILSRKTAKLFSEDAVAFYEPLGLQKLGITDLLTFMRRRISHHDVVYFIVAAVVASLPAMLLPNLALKMTGTVVKSDSYSLFAACSIVIIMTIFMSWLFKAVQDAVSRRIKWKITIPVEQAVMQRLLTLPVPFFRQFSAGELHSRSESIESICEIIIEDFFSLGITSLVSLAYLFHIKEYSPRLCIAALVVIMLTLMLTIISTLMQMRITRKHMEIEAHEMGLGYAIISGIQKIKVAGAEKRIFAKWADHYAEGAALVYNPPFFLKINTVLSSGIAVLGTCVFYTIAIKSNVSASEYFAFNIAYGALFTAFSQISVSSLAVARIRPVLDMAEPILNAEPEKTLKKQMITRLGGGIQMEGVYFRYSEQTPYILENFSLKVKAGEYIGIVGKTGCGKSTLVRLLLGFEKPQKGVVLYDGKDIERIDLKSLRRKIGSVIQDAKLFHGDIFQNIAIASEKLTQEEAWEAAEIAGIAEDIRQMPMGMNTMISEGQGGISGGQRQRILIARAIASKPKVLIFDEATSALDNITQKKISEALDNLKCTRIVIAHRLSTIKNCDRIIVLEDGKVAESGTYDELMGMRGVFFDLVERQQL